MKHLVIASLFLTVSCAQMEQRKKQTDLQTQILNTIQDKKDDMQKCAQDSNLFEVLDSSRIRVGLFLTINAQGDVEKINLDKNQSYPDDFQDCIFKVAESFKFPKLEADELIEVEQPLIFYQE